MEDLIRKLWARLNSIVSLAVVDRRAADGTHQVLFAADRVSSGVEHLEPQGLHFAVPADAQGALLSPSGNKAASVLVGAGGRVPSGALPAGEGGLHYLGEWRVYLAADGTLALSAKAPSDWVARASLVDARLSAIQSAFDAHTHMHSPGPNPPVPTAPPGSPIGSLASVASTKVRTG